MSTNDDPRAAIILDYMGSEVTHEADLARVLDVSPDVVRELIWQMAQENLVEGAYGGGWKRRPLNPYCVACEGPANPPYALSCVTCGAPLTYT